MRRFKDLLLLCPTGIKNQVIPEALLKSTCFKRLNYYKNKKFWYDPLLTDKAVPDVIC